MGKKGGMPIYKTVDDYIANQSEEAQVILQKLRALIKEVVPDVIEKENYKVPSFILVPNAKPEHQIMLMASTKAVSFYPYEATINHFADQLNDFELGKGTIKFKFNQNIPVELIKEMIAFRKTEIEKGLE